ncbi:tetraacyldisaccharide 4'-kinase [Zeaxanthinibacter enoshimensis]|uniref:Tetraacyldisaccharide 4'-kinase n=1 Tax=Zeaxanthinibacter enoshimensis TaxID=392009 RepID=A0A4R6TN59_9FLAO|nr:tetraacyldisaccharide 4'-kinase [Zeaxanthinibacter enoshimensis]TDQ30751.1 tetraacyldisaccharide 4'-kinase [Zeaxanthinibacter enoshimensis]
MQLLRKIAFPISLLYALAVYLRNFLFDTGILSSVRFDTPTICVGNISVGGSGKTPMTELLVRMLQPSMKLAVLSRGYRRKTSGFVLADENSTASDLGDEPLQIYRKFPGIHMAVDADRRRGISQLEKLVKPDMIILDDAFQHRRVKPDISILLTPHDLLYTDDWYLPTGDLRDSKAEAKRADVIIVTKCPRGLSIPEREKIKEKLNPGVQQLLLFSCLEYDTRLRGGDMEIELEDLKGREITLLTGIAKPEPLENYLSGKGLSFKHLRFPDHHDFTEKELSRIREEQLLLTTEKDYTRIGGRIPGMYYIPVRHRFLFGGEELLKEKLLPL